MTGIAIGDWVWYRGSQPNTVRVKDGIAWTAEEAASRGDLLGAQVREAIAALWGDAPLELEALLQAVKAEIQRARGLFPDPNLLTLAHAEEAGELTKAVLEESVEDVRKEAIQAAAMALRLVLDGDPSTDAHRERQGLKKLGAP